MKKILLWITLLIPFYVSAQEEVVLKTDGFDIHGTLLVPENVEKPVAALFISGSGPTDRDGNNAQMKNNSLKQLAEDLHAAGIASLRFDKRGIAESHKPGQKESDLTFDTFVDDVRGWIRLLAEDGRFSKIVLAGHSEGSEIALVAAQDNKDVAGVVSIAGAGRPLDVILLEQLSAQLPEDLMKEAEGAIESIKRGETVNGLSPVLAPLFRESVQPFLASVFKYDPAKLAASLTVPILIVQGDTDIQVTTGDAEILYRAAPKAQKAIVRDMNHVLKECSTKDRVIQISTYSDPGLPNHPDAAKHIISFIKKLDMFSFIPM